MGEGKVPNGESLEFGIAGLHSALVFLIKLAQAHGHLAAAGAGGRHHHQGLGSNHIVILAKTLVRVYQSHIVGISFNGMVIIDGNAHVLQALAIGLCTGLSVEVGDYHGIHAQVPGHEFVPQTEHVHVVGDAQVAPYLVFLYVYGADDDNNLQVFLELEEHLHLAVRMESRKDTAGVIVVKQLSAKLHVQFIAELGDALLDVLRLNLKILFVVEPVFHKSAVC